jgi:hypothetical protein
VGPSPWAGEKRLKPLIDASLQETGGIRPQKRRCSLEEFWLHAESAMLISNAFGLDNVHRPVRNRDLWRGLQPLRPFVVDRDKALINAVSMRVVAEKRKGSLDYDWRSRGIV